MKYPKIGIRPVIDGRWGGIRESLEGGIAARGSLCRQAQQQEDSRQQ